MPAKAVEYAHGYLERSAEVGAMMKVVGEEGTSLDDYVYYLKGEFLDAVYLQQNSFDPVDASVSPERQKAMFRLVLRILGADLEISDKEGARGWFYELRQAFLDLNGSAEGSSLFSQSLSKIEESLAAKKPRYSSKTQQILASLE
jgi:V/A-type H+-transporting ATPase subunit A